MSGFAGGSFSLNTHSTLDRSNRSFSQSQRRFVPDGLISAGGRCGTPACPSNTPTSLCCITWSPLPLHSLVGKRHVPIISSLPRCTHWVLSLFTLWHCVLLAG